MFHRGQNLFFAEVFGKISTGAKISSETLNDNHSKYFKNNYFL